MINQFFLVNINNIQKKEIFKKLRLKLTNLASVFLNE